MRSIYLAACVGAAAAVGCDVAAPDESVDDEVTDSARSAIQQNVTGKKLFEREEFQGNGRTCTTCHDKAGGLAPKDVKKRFNALDDCEDDPLFRSIDSDDGVGDDYTRLIEDATILVHIPLPPGWHMADDPAATSATFARGVPTTINVSLDTIFMYDGRNSSLEEQALGAVNSHYEPGRQPTQVELEKIADHQGTNQFFSSNELKQYANGGPAPQLPPGHTAAEKRGRNWFIPSVGGVCGHCHAGPMLNETSQFLLAPLPPGSRFFTAFVSELNKGGNPVQDFVVDNPDGTTSIISTPDPGRALITGNLADLNTFKIPTVWGAKDTAPYFHDNSAKDLTELMQHYSDYFQIVGLPALSAQEQKDIIAYVKLL